jgi:tRNA-2-methylthio-N6-dimethylallyladenosine synthase
MKYFIQTFGCQQNQADSERIAGYYQSRGFTAANGFDNTDVAVLNTCIVRQQAEDKIRGLVNNLVEYKKTNPNYKIVITGCLVGAAHREPSGQRLKQLHKVFPDVDEFLPLEEVGFDHQAIRGDKQHALVPISNGCNNFCTFCIVPFSRGKERSRPFSDIVSEVQQLAADGFTEITLLGQNVNSYGADLVKESDIRYTLPSGTEVVPVFVKHLGRLRIPTLFPHLLEMVANTPGITKVNFMSSNPWDFSDELIQVIAENKNINREIHLPIQAGDDGVLKRMNRWYTTDEYRQLVDKIRSAISGVTLTTDIIVGFPGESVEAFQNTATFAQSIKFTRAFISYYSPRIGTAAAKVMQDDVPYDEKKRRYHELDKIINSHLRPK